MEDTKKHELSKRKPAVAPDDLLPPFHSAVDGSKLFHDTTRIIKYENESLFDSGISLEFRLVIKQKIYYQ